MLYTSIYLFPVLVLFTLCYCRAKHLQ